MTPASRLTNPSPRHRQSHASSNPELTNAQVVEGLELAKRYGVATVTVRPCDMDLGVRILQGSPVRPGSIVELSVRLPEHRRQALRSARPAAPRRQRDRRRDRRFQAALARIPAGPDGANQMSEACRGEGARLTVILETSLSPTS